MRRVAWHVGRASELACKYVGRSVDMSVGWSVSSLRSSNILYRLGYGWAVVKRAVGCPSLITYPALMTQRWQSSVPLTLHYTYISLRLTKYVVRLPNRTSRLRYHRAKLSNDLSKVI